VLLSLRVLFSGLVVVARSAAYCA